jgi:hypothetical protein
MSSIGLFLEEWSAAADGERNRDTYYSRASPVLVELRDSLKFVA